MKTIKELTLRERMQLLIGKDFKHTDDLSGKLPSLKMVDGAHGVRKKDYATGEIAPSVAFPSLSMVASTWSPELARLQGETVADECIDEGVDILLAPGVNIKRSPLCGRNFEYFSEDPYLSGEMAKAYIEGVQSHGVGTSLKHFCLNNSEYDRNYQSSEADKRTLYEIYLPAFRRALEAEPYTVMASYNPVGGIHAAENRRLLADILRGELGFRGVVISDWFAVHCGWRSLRATLDLRMPPLQYAREELEYGLRAGYITEAEIDEAAERMLALIERVKGAKKVRKTEKGERHAIAAEIAREGIVLLKNEGGALPLAGGDIVVAGPFEMKPPYLGSGSAYIPTDYSIKSLASELKAALPDSRITEFGWAFPRSSKRVGAGYIYKAAYTADKVVLCVGTGEGVEGEDKDRTDIRLSFEQEELILKTAKQNPHVIVVLYAGSAVDMSAWIDRVEAVLLVGFGGEGIHEAARDILVGRVAPSGKLAESFPLSLADIPQAANAPNGFVDRYEEGLLVGYRYYDTKEKEVLFPFGHGLSYVDFSYEDLKIEKKSETDYIVSFDIVNTGERDAKEVAQLYVRDVFSYVTRPRRELRAFAKVLVRAGERRRVSLTLDASAFAFYSDMLDEWHIEDGMFEIEVGASSRDIRLVGRVEITMPEGEQYTTVYHYQHPTEFF